MPETPEERLLRYWVDQFIRYGKESLPAHALQILGLCADAKDSDIPDIEIRQKRLLKYASTICLEMVKGGYHKAWATRLRRLADSIPDTHGLLIQEAYASFPSDIKRRLSWEYTTSHPWKDFATGIMALSLEIPDVQPAVPTAWHSTEPVGPFEYDKPHNTGLVYRLTRYSPQTWRGADPDRRPVNERPGPSDKAWEDDTGFPLPDDSSLFGGVLAEVAPPAFVLPGSTKKPRKNAKRKRDETEEEVRQAEPAPKKRKSSKAAPAANANSNGKGKAAPTKITTFYSPTPPSVSSRRAPKARTSHQSPEGSTSKSTASTSTSGVPGLTVFGFTRRPPTQCSAVTPSFTPRSLAGISTKMEQMGVRKPKKSAAANLTADDIDCSQYLRPSYLYPCLDDEEVDDDDAVAKTGMELMGTVYDARDIILDLKTCFLEIEPLLHCSPQIFEAEDWRGVMRVPATHRGFRVVLALEMATHTIAWLSMDGNCSIYWFSRADFELMAPGRVPDVLLDYWNWSRYTVKWLEAQDVKPIHDKKSISRVLSQSGSHPTRSLGRYSLDELLAMAGIPPWTIWGDVRRDPAALAILWECFFAYVLERFYRMEEFVYRSRTLNAKIGPHSWLLITTKPDVIRYTRSLRVHRKLSWATSFRRRRLVTRYNTLSLCTYDINTDGEEAAGAAELGIMQNAPRVFDLAEVAHAVLLPGHLGPVIAGKDWNRIFREEAVAATTNSMRENATRNLPGELTSVQTLMFKPVVDLTDDDKATLYAAWGSDKNPIVTYFERKERQEVKDFFGRGQLPLPTPVPKAKGKGRALPGKQADHVVTLLDTDVQDDLDARERQADTLHDIEEMMIDGNRQEWDDNMSDLTDLSGDDLDDTPDGNAAAEDQAMEGIDDGEDEVEQEDEEGEELDGLDGYEDVWEDIPLTLLRDRRQARIPTRLAESEDGGNWSLLIPPRSTTRSSPEHTPKTALVFKVFSDGERRVRTIKHIKKMFKRYTVGPADFCGHAKAFRIFLRWVIAPCRWHPRLSREDQIALNTHWETTGTWKKGVQKLSKAALKTELAFRNKVRADMKKTWPAEKPMRDEDVLLEVRARAKVKRLKLAVASVKREEKGARGKARDVTNALPVATTTPPSRIDASPHKSERLRGRAPAGVSSASKQLGIIRRGPRKKAEPHEAGDIIFDTLMQARLPADTQATEQQLGQILGENDEFDKTKLFYITEYYAMLTAIQNLQSFVPDSAESRHLQACILEEQQLLDELAEALATLAHTKAEVAKRRDDIESAWTTIIKKGLKAHNGTSSRLEFEQAVEDAQKERTELHNLYLMKKNGGRLSKAQKKRLRAANMCFN
ncbi:hypothetical protein C8R43DRAFT_1241943 [Mycena crocata]|nr:hypothetical protein C8R43DRAFT_1241943 [Mycena crocata]